MAAMREVRSTGEKVRETASDPVDLATRHLVQPWPVAGSAGAEARALIGEGDGIYIADGDGKRLIDGPAGMWCVNVAHRREELARVMYEQAMRLSYNTPWYTMNAPSAELARRIAGHAPGDLSHVFYTTGGSSAVETALRFMQFYNNVRGRPEKKLILSRGGAYHGSTYLSASLNGRPRDRDWMDGADDLVVKLGSPDPFRRPKGMSVEAFRDAARADEAIRALARKVSVREDPVLTAMLPGLRPARLRITLRDGRTLAGETLTNRGDTEDPYSREEIIEKFHEVAGPVWSQVRREQIVAAVEGLAGSGSVTGLIGLLSTTQGGHHA